jgi:NIMA (never in mitosis gene a)-related kinase
MSLNHAFDALSMKGLVLKILKGNYPKPPGKYSKELMNLLEKLL